MALAGRKPRMRNRRRARAAQSRANAALLGADLARVERAPAEPRTTRKTSRRRVRLEAVTRSEASPGPRGDTLEA